MADSRLHDQLGSFRRVVRGVTEPTTFSGRLFHDVDDSRLHLTALDPDPLASLERGFGQITTPPECLLGSTEVGGVVLFNLSSTGWTFASGLSKESVLRFGIGDAAIGLDIEHFRDLRIRGASVVFPDALRWANESTITSKSHRDAKGRLTAVDLKIKASNAPSSGPLSKSRTLTLSGDWQVLEEGSSVTVSSGLDVNVAAKRARNPEELLKPLRDIQLLLAVALQRPVMATRGAISLNGLNDSSQLWDYQLFERTAHRAPAKGGVDWPCFGLADLNGISGLRRWVDLCEAHPRAVGHLRGYTHGFGTLESELRTIAAGIEYWVALHRRRKAPWALKKGSNKQKEYMLPLRLAWKAGKPFADLVDGGVEQWAKQFWDSYNALKHDPGRQLNGSDLAFHTAVGLFLFETTLLNHCAGSQAPARAFLSHYQGQQLRSAVQAAGIYK